MQITHKISKSVINKFLVKSYPLMFGPVVHSNPNGCWSVRISSILVPVQFLGKPSANWLVGTHSCSAWVKQTKRLAHIWLLPFNMASSSSEWVHSKMCRIPRFCIFKNWNITVPYHLLLSILCSLILEKKWFCMFWLDKIIEKEHSVRNSAWHISVLCFLCPTGIKNCTNNFLYKLPCTLWSSSVLATFLCQHCSYERVKSMAYSLPFYPHRTLLTKLQLKEGDWLKMNFMAECGI